MPVPDLTSRPFTFLPALIAEWAAEQSSRPAVTDGRRTLSYGELDGLMDRVAAALQRDGVENGDVAAVCATASLEYAAAFLGTVRAGAAIAPLAPASTPQSLAMMLADCGAKVLFLDAGTAELLAPVADRVCARRVTLDGSAGGTPLGAWLAPEGAGPAPVEIDPAQPFNIIYSSGTTGAPKGIVQPHEMRWAHVKRKLYPPDSVTMVSTPLYSNTTLVSFLPAVTSGGLAVLMPKFDAGTFLELSQRYGATHAMLVPVQYRRLMGRPDFDSYDLSSYRMKYCTSAPFPAELKADVLRRWPGGLVEFYGMTEGGVTFCLPAHEHPDKLHTVGRPLEGHEARLIDENGREVPAGEVGEVVGRSPSMMVGYHNSPERTAEAEWWSPGGDRFIRTGDLGRLDAEGFLTLVDRKKDVIISGGFNIYPSDLEAELARHDAVLEAAVAGVPSAEWGETPVAFVTLRAGAAIPPEALRAWVNGRVAKTQRLAEVRIVETLPRSPIGKVLKRELRDAYAAPAGG